MLLVKMKYDKFSLIVPFAYGGKSSGVYGKHSQSWGISAVYSYIVCQHPTATVLTVAKRPSSRHRPYHQSFCSQEDYRQWCIKNYFLHDGERYSVFGVREHWENERLVNENTEVSWRFLYQAGDTHMPIAVAIAWVETYSSWTLVGGCNSRPFKNTVNTTFRQSMRC